MNTNLLTEIFSNFDSRVDRWINAEPWIFTTSTLSDVAEKRQLHEKLHSNRWFQTGSGYELNVALPGVARESIEISLEKNVLCVETTEKNPKFSYNTCVSVNMPSDADVETLASTYVDGIVTVTCQKLQTLQKRVIHLK